LADRDPDVDAIYRLTQRLGQFDFGPGERPLALPSGTFAPFNAQACTFEAPALWALFLPATVPVPRNASFSFFLSFRCPHINAAAATTAKSVFELLRV